MQRDDLKETRQYFLINEALEARTVLEHVYVALSEKGYNPINQLTGYLLTGDPAYITNHNGARNVIRQMRRDVILEELVRYYLGEL